MTFQLGADLTSAETYAAGTPHELFARLRRECPVYWHERRSGDGFWCITKHADMEAISLDTKRFANSYGTSLAPLSAIEMERMAGTVLPFMDAPRHPQVRGTLTGAFTPKSIVRLAPMISRYIDRAIDAVIERGECDFYDVAADMPILVICDLLGVPEDMHAQVLDWTNRSFGRDEPEFSGGSDDVVRAQGEMFAYAMELAAERRRNPKEDLISSFAGARIDGEFLTDAEIGFNFAIVMTAGNDTTRTLILHALNILMDHPEQFAELRADTSLVPNMLEEVLRLEPSVRGMGRTALEPLNLRGVEIAKGDYVYLWYNSGNRDEDVFEDPDAFDIRRSNARKHTAFGASGPHICLGAALARAEARMMFEQIVRRLPDISRAGPAVRSRSTGFANSIKHLPVRFTPGARLASH